MAARVEARGLRHGKHSSLPKRVAASHSLRRQQMRHTHRKSKELTCFLSLLFFCFFSKSTHRCIRSQSLFGREQWTLKKDRLRGAFSRWVQKGRISKKITTSGQPFPGTLQWMVLCTFLSFVTAQLLDATQMGMQNKKHAHTHTHTYKVI